MKQPSIWLGCGPVPDRKERQCQPTAPLMAPSYSPTTARSHAKAAIEQAGQQLRTGRTAVVLTVWQPLQSIPFAQLAVVPDEVAETMGEGARKTAAEGVELARAAGFDAEPLVEVGRACLGAHRAGRGRAGRRRRRAGLTRSLRPQLCSDGQRGHRGGPPRESARDDLAHRGIVRPGSQFLGS